MGPHVLVAGPDRLHDYLQPYCDAIRAAGGEPIRSWPGPVALADEEALSRYVAGFRGLLLPGGADVEPWRYGEAPHSKLGTTDQELDSGQLALAGLALRSRLPTLAICRGIQVLGVAAGATLYQHLPAQRPSEVSHEVRSARDALAHEVTVAPGSRLAELIGAGHFPVNSRHHQAVREGERAGWVGPLRVVARAPDGLVEGLEGPDLPFTVAVQWHPENLVASRREALRLFQGFVSACADRQE